ncbi:hypothetical protein QQ045_001342 [Rhodiola kirilowii]
MNVLRIEADSVLLLGLAFANCFWNRSSSLNEVEMLGITTHMFHANSARIDNFLVFRCYVRAVARLLFELNSRSSSVVREKQVLTFCSVSIFDRFFDVRLSCVS